MAEGYQLLMFVAYRIGQMYLSQADNMSYRVQVYRSAGQVAPNDPSHLRIYVVRRTNFACTSLFLSLSLCIVISFNVFLLTQACSQPIHVP